MSRAYSGLYLFYSLYVPKYFQNPLYRKLGFREHPFSAAG